MTTSVLAHGLFALMVIGPWLYLPVFHRHVARIRAGAPDARVPLYRQTVAKQVVVVTLLLGLHMLGGVFRARFWLGGAEVLVANPYRRSCGRDSDFLFLLKNGS